MDYLTDKEFDQYFKLLNAICGDYSQWRSPKALKLHKCEFGCDIFKNEQYFRKGYNLGTIKLCKNCMEKMLFIFFATDPGTTKIACWVRDKRFEKMRKAVEKLR
ncbi:hypothetical protein KAW50_08660 [candidate division WOR-3 bacterium]|nr:hypothetical protein [candidate division WOR-3 bacterium]